MSSVSVKALSVQQNHQNRVLWAHFFRRETGNTTAVVVERATCALLWIRFSTVLRAAHTGSSHSSTGTSARLRGLTSQRQARAQSCCHAPHLKFQSDWSRETWVWTWRSKFVSNGRAAAQRGRSPVPGAGPDGHVRITDHMWAVRTIDQMNLVAVDYWSGMDLQVIVWLLYCCLLPTVLLAGRSVCLSRAEQNQSQ